MTELPPTPDDLTEDRVRTYMAFLMRMTPRELALRQDALKERIGAIARSGLPKEDRVRSIAAAEVEEVLLLMAVDRKLFAEDYQGENLAAAALEAIFWRTRGKAGKRPEGDKT